MPNLGSILPFSTDVYDKPEENGGVLTNAASAVLTVTLPDGTTVTPTVTNPSTGKYVGNYQTTAASPLGRYLGHWVLTFAGGAIDTYDETIDVVATLVTVGEALQHLRAANVIKTEPDLDYLEWLCSVATNAVELALGRNYVRKTVVEVHSGGSGTLILRHSPVLSVTSVSESGSALSASDYVMDPEMPILYRGSTSYGRRFSSGRLNVTVTYVVGSLNPHPVVRKVVLNAVQGMWQSSQQAPHTLVDGFEQEALGVATAALTPLELNAYKLAACGGDRMSSIAAAESALAVLLTPTLPTVQVIESTRGSVTATKSQILTFGSEITGTREFSDMASIGGTERYDMTLTISVALPGTSAVAPRTMALELFETACVAINAADFGPQMNIDATGRFSVRSKADGNGRECAVDFTVEVFSIL